MLKYLLKRIVLVFFTLFIILTIAFFMIKSLPNANRKPPDPNISDEYWQTQIEKYGYDKPIFVQYFYWLKGIVLEGHWGESQAIKPGMPVFEYLLLFIPITLRINIYAFIIFIPIGFLLGIIAALRKNKPIDYFISTFVIIFISVPSFVVVTFLMLSAFDMGLPIQYPPESEMKHFLWIIPLDANALKALVIPVMALSFGPIASLTRFTRAELTEVLTSEYLLLARTKGLNKFQSTVRHALRNSLVPLVPMIIFNFIGLIFGSLVVERIYGVPGVGGILIDAISMEDYNLTMAALTFYTLIDLFAILLVDLSYGIVDPRIRMGAR